MRSSLVPALVVTRIARILARAFDQGDAEVARGVLRGTITKGAPACGGSQARGQWSAAREHRPDGHQPLRTNGPSGEIEPATLSPPARNDGRRYWRLRQAVVQGNDRSQRLISMFGRVCHVHPLTDGNRIGS